MGLRFHKAFSLIPGLKLNLSKTGPSVSLGGKGFTYNIGRKGGKTTVGLPGSGLSYSTYSSNKASGSTKFLKLVLMAAIAFGVYYIRQH